mgnify:CR=1 FL=1
MRLSNIKRIEIESLAFSLFLHLLVLFLYGVIAIRPQAPIVSKTMVKLNLAGMDTEASGLEPADSLPSHPPELPEAKLQAGNAVSTGSFAITGPVDEIFAAKPPVDIEFADVGATNTGNEAPVAHGETTQQNYLELLQNTVQQKSSIPAEAAMNNISGKAVLRLEFDRKGFVKHYSLKQSTGNKILDAAAMDLGAKLMTEPLPAPPASFFPEQQILKFDFGIDYDPVNQ